MPWLVALELITLVQLLAALAGRMHRAVAIGGRLAIVDAVGTRRAGARGERKAGHHDDDSKRHRMIPRDANTGWEFSDDGAASKWPSPPPQPAPSKGAGE